MFFLLKLIDNLLYRSEIRRDCPRTNSTRSIFLLFPVKLLVICFSVTVTNPTSVFKKPRHVGLIKIVIQARVSGGLVGILKYWQGDNYNRSSK